ncbi:hypothetical protein AB0L14_28525 [Streptomyces sp. NPDC052727]|uniref:hypothetical protein n=1 Tax=Streptomyces sp. NPDC052727 TaxID=3154854 RepID=UPI003444592A
MTEDMSFTEAMAKTEGTRWVNHPGRPTVEGGEEPRDRELVTVQKRLNTLMGTALAGAAFTTVLAATPAHAEQQYTVQSVATGRCLSGHADRTVRQGPCDANAKWMEVYRRSSTNPDVAGQMLVHVATGMCLDHNYDKTGIEPYLSPCSVDDYGQLIGMISKGGNRIKIGAADGEWRLTAWNTGSVSFELYQNSGDKQLWATI